MANVINTRIQLKYDTLANWQEKNPTLLSGEIAIATVGNSHTTTTPDNGTHPVVFKVGPGAYNSLPFTSALAADVYAWAKEATLTVNKDGEGNVVAGIEWDATANGGKGGLKYTTASVATSEGLKAVQDAIKAINDELDTFGDIVTHNAAEFATKSEFDILKGKVEDEDGALAKANSAYELAETKLATATFTEFQSSNTQAIADAKAGAEATAAGELTKARGEITTEIGNAVAPLATKTELNGVKETANAAAPQATTYTKNEVDTEIDNAVKSLLGEDVSEAYDTFKELQIILDGAEGAQGLIDEVAANKGAIEDLVDGTTAAKKASSLDETGVAQVKGIKVDAATTADNYTTGGAIDTDIKAAAKAGTDAAKAVEDSVKDGAIKAAKATDADTLGGVAPSGYKTKQTAVADPTANGHAETFISSITQNENGEIVATKKNLPNFYYSEADGLHFGNQSIAIETSTLAIGYGSTGSNGDSISINIPTITKDDLSAEVKGLLDKADTAIQADDLHAVATSGSIYDLEEVHTTTDATITGGNYLIFSCGSASVNI